MNGYSRRKLACMSTKEIKEKYLSQVRLPIYLRREDNELLDLKQALEERGIEVQEGTNPKTLID